MRDYERLRKVLGDLVTHAYECDVCYEDRCDSDCERGCHEHKHVAMAKAKQMLAEIPETSEMERLREQVIQSRNGCLEEAGDSLDDWDRGYLAAMRMYLIILANLATGRSKMLLSEKALAEIILEVIDHEDGKNLRVIAKKAAKAIADRMKAGVVWEGDGWVFGNGIIEFETAERYLTSRDLLLPVEDGEAVWITVTKLTKLEGEDGQTVA